MECEFTLQGLKGKLFCRDDGLRCHLCAEGVDDKRGLYKVYLHGVESRVLMGTLMPEQGMLRLRRSMSIAELKRKECWPISGGSAELAFSFSEQDREALPEGWRYAERPDELLGDTVLRESAAEIRDLLIQWGENSFCLAAPYGERKPFPLSPLFCFGVPRRLGQRRYIVYRFDRSGQPRLPREGTGRRGR